MKVALPLAVLFAANLVACDPPPPEPGAAAAKDSAAPGASGVQSSTPVGPVAKGPFPESSNPAMQDPSLATEQAPETFVVKFDTTVGEFSMKCYREWAPNGADRIYNLVKIGFYDDVGFFRVIQKPKPFVVQFGIHGNPRVMDKWRTSNLPPDDAKKQSNTAGKVTFAMAGSPDTRSTQLFVNYGDNSGLDGMGFAPVCEIIDDGMTVVNKIHSAYADAPSRQQPLIQSQGNAFLRKSYPELDYIKTARLAEAAANPDAAGSASAAASGSAAPSTSAAPSASAAPAASASPKKK